MCNQQGHLAAPETVRAPIASSAPRPALQAGGRAGELASALEGVRAKVPGQPKTTPRAIPVVAAPTSLPLPVAAIPEVRAAVEQVMETPVETVEAGPAPLSFKIQLSEFKGHQQRNLGRVMGDKMVVKGLGVVTFKKEGNELVVTLPQGKTSTQSQVTAALQRHLNS